MQESLPITHVWNHLFGGVAASALHAVGIPANPATAINDTYALELTVTLGLILFFLIVRFTLSVEKPNPVQQIAEIIHEFTTSQGEQIIGHEHSRFQAFTTCIGLFVLLNNFTGLIPRVITSTSQYVVPLGIAVLTFLYYNFHALRVQGLVGYMKHLAGPLWWLTPLLFPIEIVSHIARIMSLSVRLYANMLASDLITLVFFSLIPFAIPSLFLGLHFFVSIIQAYVFMLLSMIYLSEAVVQEH
jgi:F-type H+-transporting ATPase subunit a